MAAERHYYRVAAPGRHRSRFFTRSEGLSEDPNLAWVTTDARAVLWQFELLSKRADITAVVIQKRPHRWAEWEDLTPMQSIALAEKYGAR